MPSSDISRDATDFRKNYTGVRMQQGRVLSDDDFNEQARLDAEDTRRSRIDVIGPAGSPDDGFLIANPVVDGAIGPTFTIKAGSFYLGGQRLTLDADEVFHLQKDWVQQGAVAGDRPPLPAGVRFDFAYLEAWQQPVSAIEDSELLEVALGGSDTSTRVRNLRRVRMLPGVGGGDCNDAWAKLLDNLSSQGTLNDEFELVPDARLLVEPDGTTGTADLCSPPVAGGYLGAENQAIRVQMVGPNLFTWGYDNAAPLYRVQLGADTTAQSRRITLLTLPKDQAHWPLAGQTIELLPWSAVLANGQKISELHGHLAKVTTSYNPDDNFFDIDVAPPNDASGGFFGETWKQRTDAAALDDEGEFFYLRVWNRGSDTTTPARIPIPASNTVSLAHTGLKVTFSGNQLRSDDFWIIAARPDAPHTFVPWELTTDRRPHGVRRWLAPLAVINWPGGSNDGTVVSDCRTIFPPLTDITAEDVSFDNTVCNFNPAADTVQAALDELCRSRHCQCTILIEPGDDVAAAFATLGPGHDALICFQVGHYTVAQTIVVRGAGHLRIVGCGPGTRLSVKSSESVIRFEDCASVHIEHMRIDGGSTNQSALNGAVTCINCPSVTAEHCTFASRGAGQRRATCLTIRNAFSNDQTSIARVASCDFSVGHLQVGLLVINIGELYARDNSLRAGHRPSTPRLLETASFGQPCVATF